MNTLHLKSALLPSGWARDVQISIADDGNISDIKTGIAGATEGCLLPGMANLHSHAHQRAMAGLAERAGDSNDSFWTWRTTMYGFLDAIDPGHLNAIAAQLYLELLKSGYTRVAEFQYLHHQTDGSHHENIAEMSLQTLEAARSTGLGITNLPVHYQFGGFGGQPISDQQRRFANNPEQFLAIVESLEQAGKQDQNVVTGIAAHSLRAVTTQSFGEVLAALSNTEALPIHIHIAEQTKEVDDCITWSGSRPVEYLYQNFDVNKNWCLIHATHMTEGETIDVARSGAVAGLCPTTEGNLGDGFFNATQYIEAGGKLGIGSDSHISTSPTEELRWFEYGQRLVHRSRNQLSGGFNRSTGRNLFDIAVSGGAQACGHNSGAIEVGKRADFVVLDTEHPLLCERQEDELLDSWIFSGNENPVRDVYVGGKRVIDNGHHANEDKIQQQFRSTLKTLRTIR
ncbi:MAG: formimidoylglutamate deiminase [Gammaproteobacteria bacterium]|nr:formimidoylglutamate deiminase [Gammaproteobacteria bacterium]